MAARPRRRRRLAELFSRRPDAAAATGLELIARRLEPRRMLDAAAPALALDLAATQHDYVQTSKDSTPQAETDRAEPLTIVPTGSSNTPPSNVQIAPLQAIPENDITSLELTFDDPDPLDSHTVQVDWGDGSSELFNVPAGSQFFGTTHQYLDDNPR